MLSVKVVATVAAALALLLIAWRLPRYWRREIEPGYDERRPFALWLLDGATYRGYVRAAPVLFVTFVFLMAVVFFLAPDDGSEPETNLGAWVSLAGVGLGVALSVSIALFNRPRSLVVPHLRNQPGAVAEWRGAELPPIPPVEQ